MSKPSDQFRFQRFSVDDDQCGMKIGTDAVLLGAWTRVENGLRIMDIGTGCGLIALMLAQRTETTCAQIDAIDIEEKATEQASKNFACSPWPSRMAVEHSSLQEFTKTHFAVKYDLCVCNPPFFKNSFPSQEPRKRMARHSTALTHQQLITNAKRLLKDTGRLCLVLPFDQVKLTVVCANENGLHLRRQTSVRPLPSRPFKRALLDFGAQPIEPIYDELTIENSRHDYTAEYAALTRSFHLRYAST